MAFHLKPGVEVPQLTLPATCGGAVCLATLPGRSVVAIYPWTGRPGQPNPPNWDDIPGAHGSTPELEGFRDSTAAFDRMNIRLFGLSRQPTAYQAEMAARVGLPFRILSDAEGAFARALGLPSFATGGVTYLERLTLLLNGVAIETVFHPVPTPRNTQARSSPGWETLNPRTHRPRRPPPNSQAGPALLRDSPGGAACR